MRQALRETGTTDTFLGVELRLIHETNIDGTEAWHVRTNRGAVISSAREAIEAFQLARRFLTEQAEDVLNVRYN